MRRILSITAICLLAFMLGACTTSDSSLRDSGHNEAYIAGFHDGRHSGMKEAGNYLEHIVKDSSRFSSDSDYAAGWLAGEEEGKRIQAEADAAAGGYTGYQIGKEVEKNKVHPKKIAKDAMKGVDTSDFDKLGK